MLPTNVKKVHKKGSAVVLLWLNIFHDRLGENQQIIRYIVIVLTVVYASVTQKFTFIMKHVLFHMWYKPITLQFSFSNYKSQLIKKLIKLVPISAWTFIIKSTLIWINPTDFWMWLIGDQRKMWKHVFDFLLDSKVATLDDMSFK